MGSEDQKLLPCSLKWEYKVKGVDVDKYYDVLLELYLKPLGSEGWELMHITERKPLATISGHSDIVHLKAYFKRQVRPIVTE